MLKQLGVAGPYRWVLAQIVALWEWARAMKDSYDDVNFTPASQSRITASPLIVYGDRDLLYPVEMAVDMYRAIPRSALWVVPNGGHGPIFFDAAPLFVQTALSFFRAQDGTPRPQNCSDTSACHGWPRKAWESRSSPTYYK